MLKNRINNYRNCSLYEIAGKSGNQADMMTKICGFLVGDVYKEHRIGEVVYYADSGNSIVKWTIVESIHDALKTGLDAYIYFNENISQFIVVFRGTEVKFSKQGYLDCKADFEMLREKTMKQYLAAYDFVTDFIDNKISSGKILNYKFNSKLAKEKLILSGHSLGGSIAQLLGAQVEFKNTRTETFNPLGMAEYLYRYEVLLKKEFKKSGSLLSVEDFREDYSKNPDHPYKFAYRNKNEYKNITNYITTRDPVGAIYDHIGVVKVVKVAAKNRINVKDVLFIAPAVRKIFSGHNQDNFSQVDSFELVKNPFTFQTLMKPLRVVQCDKFTKNVLAPILCAALK